MSVLTDQRRQIRDALVAAGINAHRTVPAKWTPPGAFVGPGDPYIDREGATFGGEIIRHQVTVVIAPGTNDTRADELDDLILTTLDALYRLEGYATGAVGRPGQVSINGQPHLAASIEVVTEIHRNPPT